MARLVMESGAERRELKVTGPITVGRDRTATVYLDDKTLSREHTRFTFESGRVVVRDLGSRNGTYLNGVLLTKPEALKPGDRVKVGMAVFSVILEAGDALPAVADALPSGPPPAAARASAAAPVAAPRPKIDVDRVVGGTPAAMVLLYRIILAAVVVGGAYLSKGFIHPLLSKIPQ